MDTFSITSFNALWGFTVDDVPYDVHAAITGFDTDLVSVQEVWSPHGTTHGLADIAADLGYQCIHVPLSGSNTEPSPRITAHPAEATGTWGVALLSRLPITATRIVDLGRLVERWDVANRYGILADVSVGATTVTVGALHLSFVLPNAAAQLRRMGGYLPRHQPSVVAGDCNLWGPVAGAALRHHRRAVRGRTWPAHRPHSQLDHIFVSPDIEVVRSAVLGHQGSDHLPVQAMLRVGPN